MAFTVTARHVADGGKTGSGTRATNSTTPTANSLFLAFGGTCNNNTNPGNPSHSVSGGSLTYTKVEGEGETNTVNWGTDPNYRSSASMWRADIGASPSAFALTLDPYTGAEQGYIQVVCCDITGHGSSAPIQRETNSGTVNPPSSSASGSVTLPNAPASGNLVVAGFYAAADLGGAFATPTLGGQPMTAVTNQNNAGWTHAGLWYRVCDGSESSSVIACSNLGGTVGNWVAIAAEFDANPPDTYYEQVRADEPLVYWRLGESSGTTAVDSSGLGGRNGTYAGSPTLGAASLVASDPANTAVAFDGVDDRVTLADTTNLTAFTVKARIKKASTPGSDQYIVARDGNVGSMFGLVINASGFAKAYVYNSAASYREILGSANLCDNLEHEVAFTFDTATTNLYLYVDGVQVATSTRTGTLSTADQSLSVGSNGNVAGGQWFAGTIDEVAYYDRALSSTRIAAHYAASGPPYYAYNVRNANSGGSYNDLAWTVQFNQNVTINRFVWTGRVAQTYDVYFNGTLIGSDTTTTGPEDVDITLAAPYSIAANTPMEVLIDPVGGAGAASIYFRNTAAAVNGTGTPLITSWGGLRAPASGSVTANSSHGVFYFAESPDTASGTGAGTWTFTGTATGKRTPKGTGTGTLAYAGTATGARTPRGTATGTLAWTGVATGTTQPTGTATGTTTYNGAATGVVSRTGTGQGTHTWTGTATGLTVHYGTAFGIVARASAASGFSPTPSTPVPLRLISATGRIPTLTATGRTATLDGTPRIPQLTGAPR